MTWADVHGRRVELERIRGSSELSTGQWVLDDARTEAIALTLDDLVQDYPIDGDIPDDRALLLDTECKVQRAGRLAI